MLTREVKVVYLLYVLASSILLLAAGDEVYGKDGGEITLSPGSLSGPLERIVWKHGDHKAIEWEGGITDVYREFKGSTSLDTKTGEMTITKLDSRFIGVYSSDVNGVQATKRWTLTLLDPVSKPIIDKNCNESTCVLTCKSNATFKVQYAWRKGEEKLRQSDGTLKLEKTDDTVGKAYTCIFRNPVSSAESDEVIPFPKPKSLVGIIVGLLSGLFILLGVIAFRFRGKLMEFVQTCRGTRGNSDADKGGAKDPEAAPLKNAAGNQDGANETSEDEPIYKNAAGNQDGANETSEVPETLDNTIDDKAAPLTPTNGDKPPN